MCVYLCLCVYVSLSVCLSDAQEHLFLQVLDLSQATDIWVALRPRLKQLSQFVRCHEPKSDLDQNVSRVPHLATDSQKRETFHCLHLKVFNGAKPVASLLLVAMPGAPSSVLAPSSDVRSP